MVSDEPHGEQATAVSGTQWTADTVAAALSGGRVRGVRLWPSAPSDDVFIAGASQAGWRCLSLDTVGVASKTEYIGACGEQIPLPDYLGRNWDALEEALGDQGVETGRDRTSGLLVVWRNWADFATAEPGDFQVALAIWRSVASDWRERLDGAAVVLAVDASDITSQLSESIADEITGISRVRSE